MKRNLESTFLKLTVAIVIAGQIKRAGSIVELPDNDAKRQLARGKAVVATEAEIKTHLGVNDQDPETEPEQPLKGQQTGDPGEGNEVSAVVATEADQKKPKAKTSGEKKPA